MQLAQVLIYPAATPAHLPSALQLCHFCSSSLVPPFINSIEHSILFYFSYPPQTLFFGFRKLHNAGWMCVSSLLTFLPVARGSLWAPRTATKENGTTPVHLEEGREEKGRLELDQKNQSWEMHPVTDNSCLYVQASNNRPGSLSGVDLSKITQDTGSWKLGNKKNRTKTPKTPQKPLWLD